MKPTMTLRNSPTLPCHDVTKLAKGTLTATISVAASVALFFALSALPAMAQKKGKQQSFDSKSVVALCKTVKHGAIIKQEIFEMATNEAYDPAPMIALGESGVTSLFTVLYPDVFRKPKKANPEELERSFKDLASDVFWVREKASKRLRDAGPLDAALLDDLLEGADPEVRMRAHEIKQIWQATRPGAPNKLAHGFGKFAASNLDEDVVAEICRCTKVLIDNNELDNSSGRFLRFGIRHILASDEARWKPIVDGFEAMNDQQASEILASARNLASPGGVELTNVAIRDLRRNISNMAMQNARAYKDENFKKLLPVITEVSKTGISKSARWSAIALLAMRNNDAENLKRLQTAFEEGGDAFQTACDAMKLAGDMQAFPKELWPPIDKALAAAKRRKDRRPVESMLLRYKGNEVYERLFENSRDFVYEHPDTAGIRAFLKEKKEKGTDQEKKKAEKLLKWM